MKTVFVQRENVCGKEETRVKKPLLKADNHHGKKLRSNWKTKAQVTSYEEAKTT